jgi:hypothetical protein
MVVTGDKGFHILEGFVYSPFELTVLEILFLNPSLELAISTWQDLSEGLLISLETNAFFFIHSVFQSFFQFLQLAALSTNIGVCLLHFLLNFLHNLSILFLLLS